MGGFQKDERFLDAIADADSFPYWFDDADEPESNPMLVHDERCDLCVVGGGYTGLWTAIVAKERNPSREVVLIEAHEVGSAASGRNGGFMDASLTHGIANAQRHFPDEVNVLEKLGIANLNEIESAIRRYGIDCDFERPGAIDIANTRHAPTYLDELREDYEHMVEMGQAVEWLDADAVKREVNSPTFTGGMWRRNNTALVDPARLAWGLKQAAMSLGVKIYEDTKATAIEDDGDRVTVVTPLAKIDARRVALATNAFKPLLRRMRNYIVPVYDYCLTTEPLSPSQLDALGWKNRQGLSDISNQFHYYRLTADNRILWGGYDAMYHFGGKMSHELESRPETWAKLSQHFFETFPQLEGIRFSHAWGGAIDTCSRISVFWGSAYDGKVAYAVGYTGLGAASSRFGGVVLLDMLDEISSPARDTDFVNSKPIPFPPEPFRFLGIQLTRWSLHREDRTGKRNLWLRLLDRLGLGFDT